MKSVFCLLGVLVLLANPAAAGQQGFQDPLLDQLVGEWVLRGTIAGEESVHDIRAEWVLEHQYLRFYELAREKDASGTPLYEAIVFIGWDEPSSQYACLWLDSTVGGGLTAGGIGHAKPSGDALPFVFDSGDGSFFHTTFAYERDADTWGLTMDIVQGDEIVPFARMVLTRQ